VQRLKLLDQEDVDDVDLANAILRLRLPLSAIHLFNTLKERGHLDKVK